MKIVPSAQHEYVQGSAIEEGYIVGADKEPTVIKPAPEICCCGLTRRQVIWSILVGWIIIGLVVVSVWNVLLAPTATGALSDVVTIVNTPPIHSCNQMTVSHCSQLPSPPECLSSSKNDTTVYNSYSVMYVTVSHNALAQSAKDINGEDVIIDCATSSAWNAIFRWTLLSLNQTVSTTLQSIGIDFVDTTPVSCTNINSTADDDESWTPSAEYAIMIPGISPGEWSLELMFTKLNQNETINTTIATGWISNTSNVADTFTLLSLQGGTTQQSIDLMAAMLSTRYPDLPISNTSLISLSTTTAQQAFATWLSLPSTYDITNTVFSSDDASRTIVIFNMLCDLIDNKLQSIDTISLSTNINTDLPTIESMNSFQTFQATSSEHSAVIQHVDMIKRQLLNTLTTLKTTGLSELIAIMNSISIMSAGVSVVNAGITTPVNPTSVILGLSLITHAYTTLTTHYNIIKSFRFFDNGESVDKSKIFYFMTSSRRNLLTTTRLIISRELYETNIMFCSGQTYENIFSKYCQSFSLSIDSLINYIYPKQCKQSRNDIKTIKKAIQSTIPSTLLTLPNYINQFNVLLSSPTSSGLANPDWSVMKVYDDNGYCRLKSSPGIAIDEFEFKCNCDYPGDYTKNAILYTSNTYFNLTFIMRHNENNINESIIQRSFIPFPITTPIDMIGLYFNWEVGFDNIVSKDGLSYTCNPATDGSHRILTFSLTSCHSYMYDSSIYGRFSVDRITYVNNIQYYRFHEYLYTDANCTISLYGGMKSTYAYMIPMEQASVESTPASTVLTKMCSASSTWCGYRCYGG